MANNELTISDFIDYLTMMLNFEIKGKLIYLDVVEELEKVSDLSEFRKEVKDRVSNLNDDYKYLNGFQKFTKIMQDYNSKRFSLTHNENDKVTIYCDKLYNKLTDFFEVVREIKAPTTEQLQNIDLDNTKTPSGLYFNTKDIQVYKEIGDTKELYRLSTQNKPRLQEIIKNIVLDLVKQKKEKTLAIENNNQKRLN